MNEMTKRIYYAKIPNPKWSIYLAATEKGLCFVGSLNGGKIEIEKWMEKNKIKASYEENQSEIRLYAAQLEEYFNGQRTSFDFSTDIKGTVFQEKVWAELNQIPYGETLTYGELAKKIEQPNSSRAVGSAIGKNPLLIIVPCHRVIHKSGKVSGYRGPIDMKNKLLLLENSK